MKLCKCAVCHEEPTVYEDKGEHVVECPFGCSWVSCVHKDVAQEAWNEKQKEYKKNK